MYKVFEQLLQKNGISSYKVSKDTGISQVTLSNWKNGISTPKQDKLKILADYFGVSLNYIMGIEEKEVYDKLKQRTILVLQGIIEGKDTSTEVAGIDDFLFSLHNPKSFIGSASAEVKYEKQFETSCMLISQKTGMTAKKMTVLEFYNTLTNIGKQAEAELKAHKRVKRK